MRQLGPKNVCSNVYVSATYYVRLYGCKHSLLIVSSLPEFEWARLVSNDLAAGGSGLCLRGIDMKFGLLVQSWLETTLKGGETLLLLC